MTPTLTATSTPVCVGAGSGSGDLFGTPAPYSGDTFVIHNLTEWQALFGSVSPPAGTDFNTQMIVGGVFSRTCSTCPVGGDSLAGVCEDATQVTVAITRPTLTAICFIAEPSVTQMLVVPQSNLPVVWQVYTEPGC